MTNSTNWKNVNNWHWTEKNCLPWTKNYLSEKLCAIVFDKSEVAKHNCSLSITKVSEIEGDVDLTQRKGKIRTLYDIKLKMDWKAETQDSKETKGILTIPEVAHDSDKTDYVFDNTITSTGGKDDKVLKAFNEIMRPKIIEIFTKFQIDLIEAHMKDVYIENSQQDSKQSNSIGKIEDLSINNTDSNTNQAIIHTSTVNESIELVTSAHDIYQVLTDQKLIQVWTDSKCNINLEPEGSFEMFNGYISGKFLELVPDKKIVQRWRINSWPKDYFSTVTFELVQNSSGVVVMLTQDGVPLGDEEEMKNNWDRYYWRSIKMRFGYGLVL